jgi:hypothetical protein
MSDRCSRRLEEDDVELQGYDERRNEREEEEKENEAPDGVLLPGRFPGRRIASPKRLTRPVPPQPLRERTCLGVGYSRLDEETLETPSATDDGLMRCSPTPSYGNPLIPAVLDSELAEGGVH